LIIAFGAPQRPDARKRRQPARGDNKLSCSFRRTDNRQNLVLVGVESDRSASNPDSRISRKIAALEVVGTPSPVIAVCNVSFFLSQGHLQFQVTGCVSDVLHYLARAP
jgi:hypothetical protein